MNIYLSYLSRVSFSFLPKGGKMRLYGGGGGGGGGGGKYVSVCKVVANW